MARSRRVDDAFEKELRSLPHTLSDKHKSKCVCGRLLGNPAGLTQHHKKCEIFQEDLRRRRELESRSEGPTKAEEGPVDSSPKDDANSGGISAKDNDNSLPPPSFNGRLSKFNYASVPTKASDDIVPTKIATRSSKRTHSAVTNHTSGELLAASNPAKKRRKASSYADPSTYAHLSPLVDILEPNLICVFVGTNPGVQTATAGHAYAHPSNHFWKLLHASGLTDRRLKPEEDRSLPAQYCMGNTNIVERPSKDAAELSKEEMAAGTAGLDAKFLQYKPEAVCIVGKGIWEAIWRYRYGKNPTKAQFKYGWQDEEHNMGRREGEVGLDGKPWWGSKVFVTTSTSGLAASLKPAEKEMIWKPFGEWVQKRRAERGFVSKVEGAEDDTENVRKRQ
jgi:mismatch-specific thymine-DNA glycosylase